MYTMRCDSFSFCCTNSEASPDTSSPSNCPGMKSQGMPCNQTDDEHTIEELSELHIAKERFSKLLLGQDMSGSGKGVSSAVAISNAITDIYDSIFGKHLTLQPLHPDTKLLWQSEINSLVSICDYIVEFIPASRHLNDGSDIQVMTSRPRLDIFISLPALKKLDAMLLETLDSLEESGFWYIEQESISGNSSFTGSFRRSPIPLCNEGKWRLLMIPCVPPGGLLEISRKHLQDMRIHTNQIHKAVKALNCSILAEMDIPDSYLKSLPKNGKTIMGDAVYHYLTAADKFKPDFLLNRFTLSCENEVIELADKIEASICIWSHKACTVRSKSWEIVKHIMFDIDRSEKNRVLEERAESFLFCLKQRYPQPFQTSLDVSKIQHNKDVGKAILESYSRVMESLAFNIVACIDDILAVDKTAQYQDG